MNSTTTRTLSTQTAFTMADLRMKPSLEDIDNELSKLAASMYNILCEKKRIHNTKDLWDQKWSDVWDNLEEKECEILRAQTALQEKKYEILKSQAQKAYGDEVAENPEKLDAAGKKFRNYMRAINRNFLRAVMPNYDSEDLSSDEE